VFRLFFLILLLASLACADFEEEWVKKYAFAVGVDFAFAKGDLDGISKINSSEYSDAKEIVILPKVPFFLVYAFDARAFANAHSMSFNLGLGFPSYKHYKYLENSGEARYLRIGIEYQYYFLWPEPFRIGCGLGYAFSSMRFPNASFGKEDDEWRWSYANLTGNGGHLVISAQYYFTENFAIEIAIRGRFLYLNRVATDLNDVSILSEAVWQGVGEFGLRGMFVF
jgi:hypothetical protein